MKNYFLISALLYCLISVTNLTAQIPQLIWGHTTGEFFDDRGKAVHVDESGNIYTTGNFSETVDFDFGIGVNNLTSLSYSNVYVQKLDSSSNLIWAKSFETTMGSIGEEITTDDLGNVYVVGAFKDTIDFDPDTSVLNQTSNGRFDIFIAKLDVNGALVWAKNFGGNSNSDDWGRDVEVDNDGNVYITGEFRETVDFDPGTGTEFRTAVGHDDIFILKLNANGEFLWVNTFGGIYIDHGSSLTADSDGNIYATGSFSDSVDFNSGPDVNYLISNSPYTTYILKLDSSGAFIWVKSVEGTDQVSFAHDACIDNAGDIYVTGWFKNTVDFDPGAGSYSLTSEGEEDIYIWKLNDEGELIWAKSIGGSDYNDKAYSIDGDSEGNIYITGHCNDTVDFDPGPGAAFIYGGGFYILKLDSMGAFKWVETVDTHVQVLETDAAIGPTDQIHMIGSFIGSMVIDSDTFNTSGNPNIFLLKYDETNQLNVQLDESKLILSVYPNPSSGMLYIESPDVTDVKIELINSAGMVLESSFLTSYSTSIDVSKYATGIYYLRTTTDNKIKVTKIIINN